MRYALENPHPVLQMLIVLLLLTLIAFAMEGCPTLGNEKYPDDQKVASEIHGSHSVMHF